MDPIKRLSSSYASVAATAALVLALGMGGAYAAGKITAKKIAVGAVTSKHIKDGQVKTADLAADVAVDFAKRANSAETAGSARTAASADTADTARAVTANAVTGAGVADGSLQGADLADDTISSAKLQNESVNESEIVDGAVSQGDIGSGAVASRHLAFGSVGGRALSDDVIAVVGNGTGIGSDEFGTASVDCPAESTLLSGGFAWQEDEENSIIYSAPREAAPGTVWEVRGYVPSGSNTLYAWASCLRG